MPSPANLPPSGPGSRLRAPDRGKRPGLQRRVQPGCLPRRRAGSDGRPPDGPDNRRRTVSRRTRRLAGRHPHALRWPGARTLGTGHRASARRTGRGSRSRPSGATMASPSGSPAMANPHRQACSFLPPDDVEEAIVDRLADTAMFAARFRENAGRALLLPRRRPGARSPLWLQRQRSANLLAVASRYGSFPIILETYRECLRDVFDLPGLVRRASARGKSRDSGRRGRDESKRRPSRAPSCSTTSPPTCTKAMPPSPNVARRP